MFVLNIDQFAILQGSLLTSFCLKLFIITLSLGFFGNLVSFFCSNSLVSSIKGLHSDSLALGYLILCVSVKDSLYYI